MKIKNNSMLNLFNTLHISIVHIYGIYRKMYILHIRKEIKLLLQYSFQINEERLPCQTDLADVLSKLLGACQNFMRLQQVKYSLFIYQYIIYLTYAVMSHVSVPELMTTKTIFILTISSDLVAIYQRHLQMRYLFYIQE